MQIYAIAALVGASAILWLTQLPPWWVLGLLFVVSIVIYFGLLPKKIIFKHIFLIGILFFVYACSIAKWHMAWQLPKSIENEPILVHGTIVSLPEQQSLYTAFVFSLTQIGKETIHHKKVKLNWYGKVPKLVLGDHWQLLVKLKRIHGYANPGSFDYAEYAVEQGIYANGYVRSSNNNKRLVSNTFYYRLAGLRQILANNMQHALGNSPYLPMIQALVIGDKSAITAKDWQILQRTGTNHLMVIAGLHVGMLSGLVFLLINFCWRLSRRLTLLLAARQAAAIAALFTALVYSALAGFSIPTVRATVMLAVFMLTLFFKRYLPLGLGLAYALLVVLLLFPLAALNVGFWLSFAAVTVIFYGMSARVGVLSFWRRWGRLQLVVSLGLIPLTLLLFQNASLIAPVANMIVIPLVGFIVVPLSLLASFLSLILPSFAFVLFHLAAWVLQIVWFILSKFAAVPWGSWQHAVTAWYWAALALIGILLLLAPRGWPAKYLGIAYLIPVLMLKPAAPVWGTAKFTLLDVGQGLASVVQTAHHVLVFDTGAKYNDNFNLGDAVVVPFLRTQGINHVDMLVISHGDNDHIGGAAALLQAMPVSNIHTSVPQRFTTPHADYCLAGQHWQWDGVQFEFLYPTPSMLGLDNNSSCVLRITAGNRHLLLTGDIEKPAENYLVNNDKTDLKANVIVAPHHGSKTSSSLAFLKRVQPQWVFYPVGYLNRFHFPSSVVAARYQRLGVKALQTDNAGAISFLLGENIPIKPIAYRKSQQRFWRQS